MNKYKKDFPIFKQKHKGNRLVYLDSAATSQKPQVVIDAVTEFYEIYNSNIHRGLYSIAEKATEKVEEVRRKVAKFINASDSSEIVFTHGTTEGINLLASSYGKRFSKTNGVLLSEMEHHSNLIPWQHYADEKKAPLDFFAIDKSGELDGSIIDVNGEISSKNTNIYSVISIAHVSNVLGTISKPGEIINKTKKIFNNPVIILDAAQSVPHMKIDVQNIGSDLLVFSGHKMFAPSGTGVLWGKQDVLNKIDPFLFGSQMIVDVSLAGSTFQKAPYIFESGTLPLEGIVGLGSAIDYLSEIGMDNIRTHEQELIKYTLEKLQNISDVMVYGPKNRTIRSGVLAFNISGVHPHDVAQILALRNICVRAGHHCAIPLHKKLGVPATVRVSFHIYNDEEDVDALVEGIKEVKKIFSIR